MKKEYAEFSPLALNGILHPIDKILIYNEDEMVGNILNERMRFDLAALIPELQCNKVRYYSPTKSGYSLYYIPENYSKNLKFHQSRPLLYSAGSQYLGLYFGDSFCAVQGFDGSFKLPNVPPRTYEIRIALNIGVLQMYIDNKVTGIPIEFYDPESEKEKIGYVYDELTDDNGVENDKQMRNRGWMKAPDSYLVCTINGIIPARNSSSHVRRIITSCYLSEGEHWLRIRKISDKWLQSVSSSGYDYIELVPLHIVSDPLKPEDRH
jgi:hypothetical protein